MRFWPINKISPLKQVEHNGKTQTVSGTGEVTISEVHLLDEQGNVTEFVSVGHRVSLQVNVEVKGRYSWSLLSDI